jgi:membrane dipeptidase
VGIVLGLEGATPIENELDRLDVLFGLGVRQIGIAYNDANALGSGVNEISDGGLTAFGRKAVRRMNQLGLLIDLSHSSDQTALDTCRASRIPVCLTDAGARSVWPTRRMKPDDVLRAVADTGGLVGISAAPHTTLSAAHPAHSIESVLEPQAMTFQKIATALPDNHRAIHAYIEPLSRDAVSAREPLRSASSPSRSNGDCTGAHRGAPD